jgi:hypothetical protein
MSPLNSEERRRIDIMEETINKFDQRLDKIEDQNKTIIALFKGLLVGIVICSVLYGWLNVQQIAKLLK